MSDELLFLFFQTYALSNPDKFQFKSPEDVEKAFIDYLKKNFPQISQDYSPVIVFG